MFQLYSDRLVVKLDDAGCSVSLQNNVCLVPLSMIGSLGAEVMVKTRAAKVRLRTFPMLPGCFRERQASLSRHLAQGEAFACKRQDASFRGRGTLLPAGKGMR